LPAATAAGGRALSRLPSGRDHGQRAVGALAGRHVRVGQHAQGEVAGGQRHGQRAVEVALVLGGGAREVERELVALHARLEAQLHVSLDRLEHVGGAAGPVLELGDAGARAALGVVERLLQAGAELVQAEALDQRLHPLRAGAPGRELGAQVRLALGAGCACGPPAR